jgi:hypothetical protein
LSKSSRMQKVAMILSSMVDLRVRGGIVPAHTGRLDKVASWVIIGIAVRWRGRVVETQLKEDER